MAEDDKPADAATWFDQMDGFLDWKIIGPDLHNPFKTPLSDITLRELASKRELLRNKMDLRCLCDGHEVLLIKNLNSPFFKTDHPCIRQLTRLEMLDYLKRARIDEFIEQEMDRIRAEIEEEILRREAAHAEEQAKRTAAKGEKKKTKKKEKEKESGQQQYRIMRR